jgi:hypothetical protein
VSKHIRISGVLVGANRGVFEKLGIKNPDRVGSGLASSVLWVISALFCDLICFSYESSSFSFYDCHQQDAFY